MEHVPIIMSDSNNQNCDKWHLVINDLRLIVLYIKLKEKSRHSILFLVNHFFINFIECSAKERIPCHLSVLRY